jgi:hypothetical protein
MVVGCGSENALTREKTVTPVIGVADRDSGFNGSTIRVFIVVAS